VAQSNRLRWGILGTARIADALVQAIRASGNSELAAVASRNIEQARAWAAEREVPLTFGSYDDLLASGEVDAVYIPLPNGLHKEWAVRAAQSGKHILCEKPLATSASEAREMIAAAEANGVKLMEAFMYRFHPQTVRLKQLVAEGVIGDVKMVRANFGFILNRPNDVRWSKELGGGALLDVGSYCVSITRYLLGAEPDTSTASAVWASSGVDETLAGVLGFPGGVLGAVGCSMQTGDGMDQSLFVSGTSGRINVSEPFRMGDGTTTITIDNLDREGTTRNVEVPGANEYHLMVEHFADAVLNDKPLAYTPQDSLGNMRALDALRDAARSGKAVTVTIED
jgi:predicted dehydrogenase